MTRDEVFAKLKVKIVEGLGVEEEKVQKAFVKSMIEQNPKVKNIIGNKLIFLNEIL